MRHVALLTSSGSQEISLSPEALQQEFRPYFEHLLNRIRGRLIHTVAIDGRPGAGKTQFALGFSRLLEQCNIPYAKVGTDDDTLPRSERNGKELVEYHPGLVLTEALKAKCNGGGTLRFKKYSNRSGDRDEPCTIEVPGYDTGILLIEGVRAIEHTRRALSKQRPGVLGKTQFVLLDEAPEVANKRRAARDRIIKGLPEAEVIRRLEQQEGSIRNYYDGVLRDLTHERVSRSAHSERVSLDIFNLQGKGLSS